MEQTLTPAQSYAKRIIDAIDGLLATEAIKRETWQDLQMLVLERPQTLRNALNAYLYKSISRSNNRY